MTAKAKEPSALEKIQEASRQMLQSAMDVRIYLSMENKKAALTKAHGTIKDTERVIKMLQKSMNLNDVPHGSPEGSHGIVTKGN
jgi:hypothetical protein